MVLHEIRRTTLEARIRVPTFRATSKLPYMSCTFLDPWRSGWAQFSAMTRCAVHRAAAPWRPRIQVGISFTHSSVRSAREECHCHLSGHCIPLPKQTPSLRGVQSRNPQDSRVGSLRRGLQGAASHSRAPVGHCPGNGPDSRLYPLP